MPVDLKRILRGKVKHAPRVLIYAADGVGKTRFACSAPDPLVVDANQGSFDYDVQRVIPQTWQDVKEWTLAVERGEVKCKTFVLDTVGDVEAMLHKELFPESSVAEYEGGWGKGDNLAITHAREYLGLLERVWAKGIGIVLVAHATVREFKDPTTSSSYDRFEVSCRPRLAGTLRGWCDYVLFAREQVSPTKANANEKVRAITTGARYIYTRRVPAYDAKARGTTLFPEQLPLSWAEFAKAIDDSAERARLFRAEIDAMVAEIGDDTLKKQVDEFLRQYPDELVQARSRLAARLEEKRKTEPPAQPPTAEAS